MEIIILGSGGFQTIPKPCCQCRVCAEARIKGPPYSRNGPSIFLKDINAIFDTPKDIVLSVNREGIKKVDNIFYTHWHTDHTEGMRIVEEITASWSERPPFELKNHSHPINVLAPKQVIKELKRIKSPLGSYFDYFESQNYIKIKALEFGKEKVLNNIRITPIKNNFDGRVTSTSYLIKEDDKEAVYMPCDPKPFESLVFLEGCDLFLVSSPFIESKQGLKKIPKTHPLRDELFSLEELIDLIKRYKIKRTVVVHIEEMWGLSYEDYKLLEKKYAQYNIIFSFDGLRLKV
ncbi:hypothetical protein DRJ48_04950 [Candidatus Woesearchaeota archaeon]|nr:MAG: hypothetical protein DRJ48_04950 [Candidatus Woesearchaeota archaeon]